MLIEKLKRYNFGERSVRWFESFLSNRRQRVKFNGETSNELEVNYGLPQGSKLANLLFILFINDLSLNLKCAKINMFADDCLLYVSSPKKEQGQFLMIEELDIVHDWLCFNKLSLNIKKCASMIFNGARNEKINITINGNEIQQESCVKYLGVYIDEKLNFECYAEKIIDKLNKRLGIMRRISSKMTPESKEIYFKAIILPVIDYCSSILITFSESKIKSIQRLMNQAMRIVLQLPRDSSVTEMHERLKIFTVNQRINFNAIKLLNKTTSRGMPVNLSSKFKKRSQVREKTLRTDNDYDTPSWSEKISKQSIFIKSVKNLNDLLTNHFDDKMTFLANLNAYVKLKYN